MPAYSSWRQIAGYFDGDGTIATSDISNQPYKLGLSLVFVDQSIDQIATLRDFLQRHGVRTSNILKRSKGLVYTLAISEFKSVKRTLRKMIPFLCKKEVEARAALDYYEGRITGNAFLAVLKNEVEAGRRERHVRKVAIDVPFTRPMGHKVMQERRKDKLRDAFGRFRAKVTPRTTRTFAESISIKASVCAIWSENTPNMQEKPFAGSWAVAGATSE